MSAIDPHSHSLVIASDYRVPDPEQVWPLLTRRRSALADIGAHHVLLYTSTHDPGRVLVTIGVRSREPIVELLRSRVFFEWFDAVGVDDIPAVFAGEIVERLKKDPQLAFVHLTNVIAAQGALPIKVGDEVIGAVGVSGAPGGDKDEVCSKAGLDKVADQLK